MERKSVDNYKTGFNESSSGGKESERTNASSSTEKRKSDQDGDGKQNAKKKSKISFGFIKPLSTPPPTPAATVKPAAIAKESKPLSMQMAPPKKSDSPKVNLAFNKAFNTDDDDDEDEMPPEARMRMRNIGRETPTSCGPNSFGKTKQGFCDARSGGTSSKLPKSSK